MAGHGKNHRRKGSRYRARRRAVDILFEAEARDVDPVAIAEERVVLSADPDNSVAPVADYTMTIVRGVAEQLDAVDDIIAKHLLDTWQLDRIAAVDRAILRVSTWELLFNPDVPWKTAIVEGVELGAEYGADPAQGFIHATLDGVAAKREEHLAELAGENTPAGAPAPDFEDPEADLPVTGLEEVGLDAEQPVLNTEAVAGSGADELDKPDDTETVR